MKLPMLAVDNNADVFGTFLGSLEENVLTALAMINRYGERSTMPKKPNRMMTYKGIALLPEISSSVLP